MNQEDEGLIREALAPVPDLARVLRKFREGRLMLDGGINDKNKAGEWCG